MNRTLFSPCTWMLLVCGLMPGIALGQWTQNGTDVYYTGGNVGIGTSTPTSTLDVLGNPIIVRRTSTMLPRGTLSQFERFRFVGGKSDYIMTVQDGTARVTQYWNASVGLASTYLVSDEAAGRIVFNPSGTNLFTISYAPPGTAGNAVTWQEKLRLTDTGRLGLGTTTPDGFIHVKGVDGLPSFISSDTNSDLAVPDGQGLTIGHWNEGALTFTERMRMTTAGYLGINDTDPEGYLHIDGTSTGVPNIFSENSGVDLAASTGESLQFGHWDKTANAFTEQFRINSEGNVGIGTTSPEGRLHISGENNIPNLFLAGSTADIAVAPGNNLQIGHWDTATDTFTEIIKINGVGNVGIGTTSPDYPLDVVGRTRTGELEITGGSDLAEPFEVNAEPSVTVAPGMVVAIDPNAPGQLRLATAAYDRRVAGIISGAGGIKPGLIMGQEGTEAHGDHPVALAGRVYCLVDAAYGAVEPGDLLTTSDTPGHAMKATDPAQAAGAIIGKAMTALEGGRGLVLVLVMHQ
jgi:hypothetical protein